MRISGLAKINTVDDDDDDDSVIIKYKWIIADILAIYIQ